MTARTAVLPVLLLLYAAASLAHFAHNALYLHDYPHLPPWLTAPAVWLAWLLVSALGALGYWLSRGAAPRGGALLLALYAACGLGALQHYRLAPLKAHSLAMNLTILAEALSAAALLVWLLLYSPLLMRVQARVRSL